MVYPFIYISSEQAGVWSTQPGFFWELGTILSPSAGPWAQGWLGAGYSLCVPVNNLTSVTPEIAANDETVPRAGQR